VRNEIESVKVNDGFRSISPLKMREEKSDMVKLEEKMNKRMVESIE
jgi:hypothetical protein